MGNKLILGAAQFGLNYGVANKVGKIDLDDAKKILDRANFCGIKYIDTAVVYGDSECQLGKIQDNRFEIFTKIPRIPEGESDVEKWIFDSINASMKRLKTTKLAGILLHEPMQILGANGRYIMDILGEAKVSGLVDMIGYSAYSPEECNLLGAIRKPDFVQVPFNLIDRRILQNNWLKEQQHKNIKVHVRSIFLQGLLLLPYNRIPKKFHIESEIWRTWHKWLEETSSTPLATCLNFVTSNPLIDGIVVGIDNLDHLIEIIKAYDESSLSSFPDIRSENIRLINPSNWAQL